MSQLINISGSNQSDYAGDIIFVHGLDGDVRSTWQHEGKPDTFWPEWVAEDLRHANVWSLDYDVHSFPWKGASMPLTDRAANILDLLLDHGLNARPIVFIAHSFGGLLVKQMLRSAVDAAYNNPDWARFVRNARGCVFFGTPHSGSLKADWLGGLGKLLRPNVSVEELHAHAPQLRNLNLWYRNNVERLGFKSQVYYETRPVMGLLIVDATSSDPGITGVDPTPLDADHINICKLLSKTHPYQRVIHFAKSCLEHRSHEDSQRLQVAYQVRPLDGRDPISTSTVSNVYPDGFKFRLRLTNTGLASGTIDEIAPLLEYRSLPSDIQTKPKLAALKFGQAQTPHQLFLHLSRDKIAGRWNLQLDTRSEVRIVRGRANLLETFPPTLFLLRPGEVELIQGAVVAVEPGLYRFALEFKNSYENKPGPPVRTQAITVVKR